jgi:hypothetical protein
MIAVQYLSKILRKLNLSVFADYLRFGFHYSKNYFNNYTTKKNIRRLYSRLHILFTKLMRYAMKSIL